MNGIDNIISKINSESSERCEYIIKKAQRECDEIISAAKADGEKFEAEAVENAENEARSIISAAESGASQLSRQKLLSEKVCILNGIIEKLLTDMKSMPDDEYFASLIRLAAENCMKGSCSAKLSSKDYERLPSDFEARLVSALAEKGASCVLSKEPASIDGGIILVYGDIEINCSFDALVEANSDILKEKAGEIIFQAVTE